MYHKKEIHSKNMLGAYNKGFIAGKKDCPKTDCPYKDLRTNYKNGVTYSSAFRSHWFQGWEDGQKDRTIEHLFINLALIIKNMQGERSEDKIEDLARIVEALLEILKITYGEKKC